MRPLIVLSAPDVVAHEHDLVHALFREGMDRFHLRKPAAARQAVEAWLDNLDPAYYPRVVLHNHYAVAREKQLGGIHLREAVRQTCDDAAFRTWRTRYAYLSTSVHSRAVLAGIDARYDAVFFSPVFPSLSKAGYAPAEDMAVNDIAIRPAIIALGGISADTIHRLPAMGYQGAALLGALWQQPRSAIENFKRIKEVWEKNVRVS